jgi:hypothetical protein
MHNPRLQRKLRDAGNWLPAPVSSLARRIVKATVLNPSLNRGILKLNSHLPPAIASSLHAMMGYSTDQDHRWPHFEMAFSECVSRTSAGAAPGDYLEFGVYQGKSMIKAYQLAQRYGFKDMRLFAFDSFEGYPTADGPFQQGNFQASQSWFEESLRTVGVNMRRVVIVPGLFGDSLTPSVKADHKLVNASLINFDCDLYEAARDALEFITDLVHPGSVIIFSNWHAHEKFIGTEQSKQKGYQRAFGEWSMSHCFTDFSDSDTIKTFLMTIPPASH